jgi:DNA-binding NarL/FixJ family response regulator
VAIKRVFIISNHQMFGRGLEQILIKYKTHIEVVGQETDVERAIQRIGEIEPDVVILDGDEPPYNSISMVFRILKQHSIPKVIGLNLQNNNLYVYEARQWMARSVEDLVTAIHNDPPQTD